MLTSANTISKSTFKAASSFFVFEKTPQERLEDQKQQVEKFRAEASLAEQFQMMSPEA
jgi:hypothetical protein